MKYYKDINGNLYRTDGEDWWQRNDLPNARIKWIGVMFISYSIKDSTTPPATFRCLSEKEAFMEML